ncbi:MAG: hypothetical protein J0L52_07825 [Caulobacterales bacterium]|nr:hypothetical protein [Caulobacterales bacterium]
MKTPLAGLAVAATLAVASPAMAQSCLVLSRIDNFGAIRLGTQLAEIPSDLSVTEQCEAGVSVGVCVLRDLNGVTYTLYDGEVISKFVFVGQGPLPWGFADDQDRTVAANLLTRQTELRATGVLDAENQVHVRSRFGCGETIFGQAFARYSGNRLVAVGLEIDV